MKHNQQAGHQTGKQLPATRLHARFFSRNYHVITRLDESLPLVTQEWTPVEQMIARLSEFAPSEILVALTTAIASFADDQARRAYILGQEDLILEMNNKAA